jgi:hypothetical protein
MPMARPDKPKSSTDGTLVTESVGAAARIYGTISFFRDFTFPA